MGPYTLIAIGLIGGLAWYFFQTRRYLDKDSRQHELASHLIAVAAGQEDVGALRDFLAEHSRSPHDRSVRLNHAVRLAATRADAQLQERVIAVARSVHHG